MECANWLKLEIRGGFLIPLKSSFILKIRENHIENEIEPKMMDSGIRDNTTRSNASTREHRIRMARSLTLQAIFEIVELEHNEKSIVFVLQTKGSLKKNKNYNVKIYVMILWWEYPIETSTFLLSTSTTFSMCISNWILNNVPLCIPQNTLTFLKECHWEGNDIIWRAYYYIE